MILGFRHGGLERLFEKGDRRHAPPALAAKIERVLARLDKAAEPGDMSLPGFGLHPLRGDLARVKSHAGGVTRRGPME